MVKRNIKCGVKAKKSFRIRTEIKSNEKYEPCNPTHILVALSIIWLYNLSLILVQTNELLWKDGKPFTKYPSSKMADDYSNTNFAWRISFQNTSYRIVFDMYSTFLNEDVVNKRGIQQTDRATCIFWLRRYNLLDITNFKLHGDSHKTFNVYLS